MEKKLRVKIVWALVAFAVLPVLAREKLKVVTTLPDLSYIAQQIGGDNVETFAIAKGYQDPHFVDAKPSFVLKLKNADIFVQIGLGLEVGWVPPLLETARNSKIYFGGKGYVDASAGIKLLEVPRGNAAQLRAKGDIHVFGNPHYWLAPGNGKVIAQNILAKCVALRPDAAALFQKNYDDFAAKIDSANSSWQEKMQPYAGAKIVAYHNSWPYFEKTFNLEIVAFIEPKPGIPPTPLHLISVIKKINKENIKVIIISPYFDDKPAKAIANRTGAKVVKIAPSVEALPSIKTYFDLFEYNLNEIISALK